MKQGKKKVFEDNRVRARQAKSVFLEKVEKRQAKFCLKFWECQFLSVQMLQKLFDIKICEFFWDKI